MLCQSKWAKGQLAEIVQTVALQNGIQLSIGEIEGELPLKWTFSNVHLVLPQEETIDIDRLQLRLAILPLLRGKIGLSYLHADNTVVSYLPSSTPPKTSKRAKFKGSYFLHFASFDQITLVNRQTNEQGTYRATAQGAWHRSGKSFFVETSLHSDSFDANLFLEGSKKLDHLQADLQLKVRSQNAFSPFYRIPYDTAFDLKAHSEGSWKTWHNLLKSRELSHQSERQNLLNTPSSPSPQLNKAISGFIDLRMSRLSIPNLGLADQTAHLTSRFSLFGDLSWQLSDLFILGPLFELKGSAQIAHNGLPKELHTQLFLPNVSRFTSYLKGEASGELNFKDDTLHLTLLTPQLTIDQTAFTEGRFEVLAHKQEDAFGGTITLQADHPMLRYKAESQLRWKPNEFIAIEGCELRSAIGWLAGDATYSLKDMKSLHGGISFQITDLAPLSQITSQELAGQLGGSIQFEGIESSCLAIGKHLKVNQFISDRVDLDLSHINLFEISQESFPGSLKIRGGPSYFQDVYFTSFACNLGWNSLDWDYQLQAQGDWKGAFDISSQGRLKGSLKEFHLFCDQLDGKTLGKQLSLKQPLHIELSKEVVKIDPLDLSIDEGSFFLSTLLSPSQAIFKIQAEHFPLDFLTLLSPRYSLSGLSTLSVELEGKPHDLQGQFNLLLERADIYPAGSSRPIQTKGNIQAHFSSGSLQLHTHLVATDGQLCEIALSAPFSFNLSPLSFHLAQDRPITGQCTAEGHVEQLFDFINMGSQRVGGFLSCRLLLSGTLNEPILHGPLSIQGGFYENYFIGIILKDAEVTGQATGTRIMIEKAALSDGEKGRSESTAAFELKPGLPFLIQGKIDHFRVIRFDWLTGACSGPFTIEGNLDKALAKGKLELDEADVTIPEQLPSDLPTLDITFVNQPESHLKKFIYPEPYPFYYELDIHGDHDLRLSGRGIEAELEGDIHMTGKNLSVVAMGTLHTKKGKFSFAGKDFNITKGELLFSESSGFLNITSNVELPDLSVTVHFRGSLRSPQLIFESNPSLPTSSILARILFNKDVSELSATQALQLANTIVTLSGGSGSSVLDSIRKNLGIDRLSFTASEETGVVSVQIGKYLTQGVMITLTQSTESSQVKVEVELKAGFVLEAETQENNQGKFSFKWNKNY